MDPDRLNRAIRQAYGAWDHLGIKLPPAGSSRWAKSRSEEGKGFLHQLFAPISQQSHDKITDFNRLFRKFSYPHFLTRMNGMITDPQAFCLSGAHHKQDSNLGMPLTILTANRQTRGSLSSQDQRVMGGGNRGNRSNTDVQRSDGSVFAAAGLMPPLEGVIYPAWPDVETFCTSEMTGLALCFDANGDCICDLEPMPRCGGQEVI